MNLVEMEPGLATTMSGESADRPDASPVMVIDVLGDAALIEKNPQPVASIAITGAAATEVVLQRLQGLREDVADDEGDAERFIPYTVTAEPEDVFGGIRVIDGDAESANTFIRKLIGSVERPSDDEAPSVNISESALEAEESEQDNFRHNALQAFRRSRLGLYAAAAITSTAAFFAAHTQSAKAESNLSMNDIFHPHLLKEDSTSPVPTGPVPGEPTDPSGGGSTTPGSGSSTGSGSETAPTDPQELKKDCVDIALQKPQVINAAVLHAGNFDIEKGATQSWFLSTKYRESMPDYCHGLYGQANKAKAQAFHNGHWVNEGSWHSVSIIPRTNQGNWEDIGNVKQVEFPVCRARILLKATSSDLSRDTGKVWAPHPIIATRTFPPVPVKKILPHKPRGC